MNDSINLCFHLSILKWLKFLESSIIMYTLITWADPEGGTGGPSQGMSFAMAKLCWTHPGMGFPMAKLCSTPLRKFLDLCVVLVLLLII